MAGPYDFAIIGSGTLSLLLAGVLARDHGRRVVRVGRKPSSERLPRGPDLALTSATRAETWQLLRDGDAETRQLIAAIGGKVDDVDVEVLADTDATRTALDHAAHLAAGYRQHARRTDHGWLFRGVTLLPPQPAHLVGWLDGLKVDFADTDTAPISFGKTGVAQIGGIEAEQVVLADDAAILGVDADQRPPMLAVDTMTMTVLAQAPRREQLIRVHADRLVTLLPRDANTMLARIRHAEDLDARLASVLAGPFPIRRLATARYRVLSSSDGAPVIGRLKPSRLFVVAGLEESAAFFAPALARLLTGTPLSEERTWFAAHDPSRSREPVLEFVP